MNPASYRYSEQEGNWLVFDSLHALVATVESEQTAKAIAAALDRSLARPPMRRAFWFLAGLVVGWSVGFAAGAIL